MTAQAVPKKDKPLHLTVDLGEARPRTILAGIAEVYKPEALVGTSVIVVANLAPRKMAGLMSEGMILAADYARRNKIPYFGLCLGMQILTIAYARNILKLADANSTEFDPDTANPVVGRVPRRCYLMARADEDAQRRRPPPLPLVPVRPGGRGRQYGRSRRRRARPGSPSVEWR